MMNDFKELENAFIDVTDIGNLIETNLNSNSLGLKFKVFYFIATLDRLHERDERNRTESFIPVYIGNIEGRYRPINDLEISDNYLPLQILFDVRDIDKIYKCFLEFKNKLVGQFIQNNGLGLIFSMTVPVFSRLASADVGVINESERRFSVEEKPMALLETRLSFVASEYQKTIYGNLTKYYFIYTDANGNEVEEEIKKIESSFANAITARPMQFMSEKTSTSIAESNAISNSISFYDSPNSELAKRLIYLAETGEIQNYKFKIRKEYLSPDGKIRELASDKPLKFEHDYIMTTISYDNPLGDLALFTINFTRARKE